jgi:hypothetical protein
VSTERAIREQPNRADAAFETRDFYLACFLRCTGYELVNLRDDPPPDIVALLKDAKTEIIARLQMERRMINHWVAAHLIDWPREHCLGCRKRVLVGQDWIDVTNGEARARFHQACHRAWLAEQEVLARRTIGLPDLPGRWP